VTALVFVCGGECVLGAFAQRATSVLFSVVANVVFCRANHATFTFITRLIVTANMDQ
jgi:hypothetical protein